MPRRRRSKGHKTRKAVLARVKAMTKDGNPLRTAVSTAVEGTDLSPMSVRRYIQRHAIQKERTNGNQLLTDSQEQCVCGVLRAFAMIGAPLGRKATIEVARAAFDLGTEWSGRGWIRRFIARNKETISLRRPKAASSARTATVVREATSHFVSAFAEFLGDHFFSADHVINCDETWVRLSDGTPGSTQRFVPTDVTRPWQAECKGGAHVTMLPFVTAAGNVLTTVYLFPVPKAKSGNMTVALPEIRRYGAQSRIPRYLMFTERGT